MNDKEILIALSTIKGLSNRKDMIRAIDGLRKQIALPELERVCKRGFKW